MTTTFNRSFDLIILGGGTAALAAVSEALDQGVERILLIEKQSLLGGECALNACVPLHSLATAATTLREMEHKAPDYGITVEQMTLDYSLLREKVERIVKERVSRGQDESDERVTIIQGEASFVSRREVLVGDTVYRGEIIFIATGTQPRVPVIPGLEESGYLLYPQATHLESLPMSLIVLGAGRIGVEFAQIFHGLGCQVDLVEEQASILPRVDPDVSCELNRLFTHEFIHTYTGCRVVKVSRNSDLKQVYLEDGTVLEAEEILVTTGRWGVTEGLNLQNAGVETDENGIIVDTMLRTTAENIWAIGDVVGPYRYTHIANYHAVIAVQNAFKEAERAVNYKTIPFVIFTEPQVAFVGLTEEMAHRQCLSVMVMKSSATEPTRFKTDSDSMGFTKVIIDAENDQIVGAHIIASQAGEMIHLLSLAMENQLSVSQITKMVYAYPTKMQLIQKTLEPYPREKARILEFARTQA